MSVCACVRVVVLFFRLFLLLNRLRALTVFVSGEPMLTVHARAWVSFFFLLLFSFFFFHYYYCYNYYGFISISMYNHIGFFFYSMQVVTGTYIYICISAIYTRAQSRYFFPLADIREPEYCVILRVSSRRIAFYCYCYFTLVEWLLLVSFFFFCSLVLFF